MPDFLSQDIALPLVFVTLRLLSAAHRPAQVLRHPCGATLFTIDPRTSRCGVTQFLCDNWTPEEEVVMRRAYGQPDSGPCADWIVGDEPTICYVPPLVRLSYEPALQGGAELDRRRREGLLEHEYQACADELAAMQPEHIPYLSRLEPA